MFTCIYCFKHEPEVIPTVAHIFPNAMGGLSSSKETVCEDCNSKTNKSFEQAEIEKFSFFQNIWGIKSRRGKVKKVRASVDFDGKHYNISLGEHGLPLTPLVFAEKDDKGKKCYSIIGDAHMVKEKQAEVEAKNPDIKWVEKRLDDILPPESVIEIASDLKRKSLRRLAAKVTYERWGQLRNPDLLNDRQYNEIRNFILNGTETITICGLLYDLKIFNSILNFPIGHHGVVIIAHPQTSILGAFVSFYSLFNFWVILSVNYQALSPFDYYLIEDPQSKKIYEPIFRAKTGNLLVHWDQIAKPYIKNPDSVNYDSIKYAKKKFQQSADKFYDSKKLKLSLGRREVKG